MISEQKRKYIQEVFKNKSTTPLVFIHTPKCGGTTLAPILKSLHITNKGHKQAVPGEGISFTIIRHPVDRFESLLHYRLGEPHPRSDWPTHLRHVYSDGSIDLNTVVDNMTDGNILGFAPYRTLVYWGKGVDIFLVMEELEEFLQMKGYSVKLADYERKNVSHKTRGTLHAANRDRIAQLFQDDIVLFQKWTDASLST